MSEPIDTSPLPEQNGPAEEMVATDDLAGKLCFTCGDETQSSPFVLGEAVVRVPTDQGDLFSHVLCFYVARSSSLEQMLATVSEERDQLRAQSRTHFQTLCAVIAKVGTTRVYPHHFERAMKAIWKLDVKPLTDKSIELHLASAIEVVSVMPSKDRQ